VPAAPRERAILVGLDLKGRGSRASSADLLTSVEESLEELAVLATAPAPTSLTAFSKHGRRRKPLL
jgi:hypothetical protein